MADTLSLEGSFGPFCRRWSLPRAQPILPATDWRRPHRLRPIERHFRGLRAADAAFRTEGPLNSVYVARPVSAQEAPFDIRCPVRLRRIRVVESTRHRAFAVQV